MKKFEINETNKETTANQTEYTLSGYASNQRSATLADSKVLSLIGYNAKGDKPYTKSINLNLSPITDKSLFKDIVAYWYYTQCKTMNDNAMKSYQDRIDSKDPEKKLTPEEEAEFTRRKEYQAELSTILSWFSEATQKGKTTYTVESLAKEDSYAQYIASTVSGYYDGTQVLVTEAALKAVKTYYELLQKPLESRTKTEEKAAYLTAKEALDDCCKTLSFKETIYSKPWTLKANKGITDRVMTDIIARYYGGRQWSKTGNVSRSVDQKGTKIRKELILICVEKIQNK